MNRHPSLRNTHFLGFALLSALLLAACSASVDEKDPDAQTPKITSISDDVRTVVNVAEPIAVIAEISDKGTLTYQWYVSDTKLAPGEVVTGATESRFEPPVGETGTRYYYCIVTNRLGSSVRSAISPKVTYIVDESICAKSPVIAAHSGNVTADYGEPFTLSVLAYSSDGGTLSYQWYFAKTEAENPNEYGNALEGETNALLKAKVSAETVGFYRCVVTNTLADNGDGGEKSARTVTDALIVSNDTVNASKPIITAQPQSDSAIIPAVHVFSLAAYVADDGMISYQWYAVADGESEGNALAGETKAVLRVSADRQGKTGYYCVATNTIPDNGDGGVKSASVTSETAWFDAVYLKDVVPAPTFTAQPSKMSVAPLGGSVMLSCEAESPGYSVSYRWYKSADGTTAAGIAVDGAHSAALVTPAATERGIAYYYCVATNILSDASDNTKSAAAISNVVSVACTGLPTVYVNTPDSAAITSKTEWTKGATISVTGAQDSSWNFDAVATSIRGRGNSTWVQPKKPYALKLDKKQKIFGLPKHKRWVLIANYLDNSFMRNEMAFYLSEQFGLDWTVHGEFVDLVLNGEYKGLYWLGEAIKVDEKRVNINDGSDGMGDDKDKDYLIEMDVYYDEPVKFKSPVRAFPYMIKNDDYMIDDNDVMTSGGEARLSRLQEKIATLETLLYPDFADGMNTNNCAAPDEAYADVLDIDSWAKFWFVNEIMDNGELGHPKSCYFTFDSANGIFKAGPVWDFDWASLSQASACRLKNTIYYNALFKSPAFTDRVKTLWSESYSRIDLATQIEAMRTQLALAAQYDTMLWGAHNDPSGIARADFDAYVDFLKETLEKKLAVVGADVGGL